MEQEPTCRFVALDGHRCSHRDRSPAPSSECWLEATVAVRKPGAASAVSAVLIATLLDHPELRDVPHSDALRMVAALAPAVRALIVPLAGELERVTSERDRARRDACALLDEAVFGVGADQAQREADIAADLTVQSDLLDEWLGEVG